MQNKEVLLLIEKIKKEIKTKSNDFKTISQDLLEIRNLTMEQKNPVLTKALRLASEHLSENDSFLIEIPFDEPIDNLDIEAKNYSEANNFESLSYFLDLIIDPINKSNLSDLKEYNKLFLAF